ncbi:hypothetical protein U6A24_13655 [Aquimarina gracilis]|uniref:Uncharacterized protein n=1 Tax=Aquimarina gracilis TaxID=874422 RepID=A0ABU5ZXD1_9FLAO|nr:hypothetical protein [Aquimarina gracilis]MEB3346518.1 hypothetical protein [Aquimarina gracilis]
MPLVKTTLAAAIKKALIDASKLPEIDPGNDNQADIESIIDQSRQKMADDIATAIHNYILAGDVKTAVTTSAGAGTGTGKIT